LKHLDVIARALVIPILVATSCSGSSDGSSDGNTASSSNSAATSTTELPVILAIAPNLGLSPDQCFAEVPLAEPTTTTSQALTRTTKPPPRQRLRTRCRRQRPSRAPQPLPSSTVPEPTWDRFTPSSASVMTKMTLGTSLLVSVQATPSSPIRATETSDERPPERAFSGSPRSLASNTLRRNGWHRSSHQTREYGGRETAAWSATPATSDPPNRQ
jgi:hypothetical protein